MQAPAYWNVIGRSMTAPPPVLSPSSNLPPLSSHCALIPATKISARISKILPVHLLALKKRCGSLKLRKLGSECRQKVRH